jgi:hypothetical protein
LPADTCLKNMARRALAPRGSTSGSSAQQVRSGCLHLVSSNGDRNSPELTSRSPLGGCQATAK